MEPMVGVCAQSTFLEQWICVGTVRTVDSTPLAPALSAPAIRGYRGECRPTFLWLTALGLIAIVSRLDDDPAFRLAENQRLPITTLTYALVTGLQQGAHTTGHCTKRCGWQ